MILTESTIDRADFERRTGWALKPEGACKGDVCVPLPDGPLDAETVSQRLGMPLLHDEAAGVWALGPDAVGGRALASALLPEIVLPDIRTGDAFALSSLRGQKVLLVAWASW